MNRPITMGMVADGATIRALLVRLKELGVKPASGELVKKYRGMEAEQFARWLDHATTDARERGMKVISVEPRLSHVGAKADQWIPVRPGKDVVVVLALTRLLIDGGHVDEPFLVTYTNAPQLVGADGKVLRDADGEPLVWDSVSSAPKRFVDGVVPALRGSYSVDGQPVVPSMAMSAKVRTPAFASLWRSRSSPISRPMARLVR